MSSQEQKTGPVETIRKNWPIILFIGGIIVWYANVQNAITNLQAASEDFRGQIEQRDAEIKQLTNDITTIKTDVAVLRATLIPNIKSISKP